MQGTDAWLLKKKIGDAPPGSVVLADTYQTLNDTYTSGWVPFSSHSDSAGVPRGGNYLFEDGHVTWNAVSKIGEGAEGAGVLTLALGLWKVYYYVNN